MFTPLIIQGGMGAGVSSWKLAQAVSMCGQLGVVSGTALDAILARRLQMGDPGGDMWRAMQHFPIAAVAERVYARYFVEGGKAPTAPFKPVPATCLDPKPAHIELTVLANFVEVFLAKEGHNGEVGINFLEKIQLPTLPAIFGALLAGVDKVLMGAGIPHSIPGALDRLARGEAAEIAIDVRGKLADETFLNRLDPVAFFGEHGMKAPLLKRPDFFPIVSSYTLALSLVRKSNGRVNGFIVEGPLAGGHNAPPRGPMRLDEKGEPIYGPKDVPDLVQLKALGLPFWLAGSWGRPEKLVEALELGASGVQAGTIFALCQESGIASELKAQIIEAAARGEIRVRTDPRASPTGFPFKVVELTGTLAQKDIYEQRRRICDLCYLRHPYRRDNGTVGYRCPAEPVEQYLRKGGEAEDTEGRHCLCNGLMATIGLGQVRSDGTQELPIITSGDDLAAALPLAQAGKGSYTAAQAVASLLSGLSATAHCNAGARASM